MTNSYLALKVLHLFAMVAWMAGLLYLPRLFVYHCSLTVQDTTEQQRFQKMEQRLYFFIMWPAMVASVLSGSLLAYMGDWMRSGGWLHAKFMLVFLMIIFHFWSGHMRKRFAAQKTVFRAKIFRIMNEVPALLLLGILYLVVFKPF